MDDITLGRRDVVKTKNLEETLCRVKAVVFDLDGTLTNSVPQIIGCTRHTFRELNLPQPSDVAIMKTIGLELEEGLTSLLPEEKKKDGPYVTQLYREISTHNKEYCEDRIFPGVETLFKKIRSHGYLIGFASGRSVVGIKRTLSQTFLGDYCDALCGGSECPSKPHPAMMEIIASRLKVKQDEILGVGDSGLDVLMYEKSGAYALGVQSGVYSGEALEILNPHFILPYAEDLADYL